MRFPVGENLHRYRLSVWTFKKIFLQMPWFVLFLALVEFSFVAFKLT